MSGHQNAAIEDTVYFWFASNDTSGSGDDGATPLFDVREAGAAASAAPLVSGTPTLLTDSGFPAGCHEIAVDATTANGFLENDTFAVFCTLAVDSQNPSGYVGSCTLTPLATSSQVDNIASGSGGAINFGANGDNASSPIEGISSVGTATGTFANTEAEDGTVLSITDVGNDIDWILEYSVGGGRSATSVDIVTNVNGNADQMNLKVYDFVGSTWDTIGTLLGTGGSAFSSQSVQLLTKHTGTGADLGKVYIRFDTTTTTPALLEIDKCLVSAVNLSQSVGYSDGRIWIDTNNGTAGTETFVNGTADNPVDSLADALTLSASLGLEAFHIASGSSITLATGVDDYNFMGNNWSLAFGGQAITGSFISGATVSGTFTGSTGQLEDCIINAITGSGLTMRRCFFNDVTITNNGTSDWYLNDCRSRVAGTGSATFDFGAGVGPTNVGLRAYSGGIEIENFGDTGVDRMSIEGNGQVTLNANCDGGTLAIRGNFNLVDNSGNVDISSSVPTITQIGGVAQSATANTITLSASASSVDGQYDPGIISIIAGTGAGQSRGIFGYDGTTKVASVNKDWRVNPDSSSSYLITPTEGGGHVNEGLAQGGAASTITLNSGASSIDDMYQGQMVFIVSGTGQDQARIVTSYDGTTKIATVHKAWETNPASTSGYLVNPLPALGDLIVDMAGATFDASTDSLEAIRDRGDAAWTTGAGGTPPQLLQSTTIATLSSQTSFTLTAGSSDDDAYNGAIVVITDSSSSVQKAVGSVSDYTGSTKRITLSADPAIFTMAVGDSIDVIAALGSGTGLTASETRDALGMASANLDTQLATIDSTADAILLDTDDLQANQGDWATATGFATAADLATVDANVDAILVDTDTTIPGLISNLQLATVRKNAAFDDFEFPMRLSSDHYTAATGKTVTGERSIDGAAFASVGGAIAEVGDGVYQFDALAADTNGDSITWKFSAADCDDTIVTFKTST